ncbi:Hypothetical protein PHPALM_18797 [Phytophthora palmivora]|uniref:PiggyBac transposable element-derived protein domain-containing protein n=1 Tax=Phytophthora palmivora TaxID=4796 RepID=A0A2P4XIV0_9STRA|nr:Hypothetical protein PHPALM_18797 [Phytophthora palmivora]
MQRAIRMLDLALVNAFIVHKLALKRVNKPVPTHTAFMRLLQTTELLSQTSEDFVAGDDLADRVIEPLPRHPHMLEKTEEMNGIKRRQWLCKVCSEYAGAGVRSCETSCFCVVCSREKKTRRTHLRQVWHHIWKNGATMPPHMQHKIRFVNKRRPEIAKDVEEV